MSDEYLDLCNLAKEQQFQVQQISYFLKHPENISEYSKSKIYKIIMINPDLFFKAVEYNMNSRE